MNMIKKFLFKKTEEVEKPTHKDDIKSLLRQNLNSVDINIINLTDPALLLEQDKKKAYLKHFDDLVKENKVIPLIDYLINEQARKVVMPTNKDEIDIAGSMIINGLSLVKDKIGEYSKEYKRSYEQSALKEFNPYLL